MVETHNLTSPYMKILYGTLHCAEATLHLHPKLHLGPNRCKLNLNVLNKHLRGRRGGDPTFKALHPQAKYVARRKLAEKCSRHLLPENCWILIRGSGISASSRELSSMTWQRTPGSGALHGGALRPYTTACAHIATCLRTRMHLSTRVQTYMYTHAYAHACALVYAPIRRRVRSRRKPRTW